MGDKERNCINFGKNDGTNNACMISYYHEADGSTNNALHIYFMGSGPQINIQPNKIYFNTDTTINGNLFVNTISAVPIEGYNQSYNDCYFKVGRDFGNCSFLIHAYDNGTNQKTYLGHFDNGTGRHYILFNDNNGTPYINMNFQTWIYGTLNVQNNTIINGTTTINGRLDINNINSSDSTNHIRALNSSLGQDKYVELLFGKSATTGNCGSIRYYWHGDNNSDNYIALNHYGIQNPLKIYRDRIKTEVPLTVNGSIKSNSSLEIIDPTVDYDSESVFIKIGKSHDAYCYGLVEFVNHNSTATNALLLSLGWGAWINIHGNGITSNYQIGQSSDRRLKENIEEIDEEESVNIIDNIKTYSFNMKSDIQENKKKYFGVLAQDLQELAPDLVSDDGSQDHYLAVNYTGLIPHLINKIHSQDKRIKELEEKLNKLYELLDIKE